MSKTPPDGAKSSLVERLKTLGSIFLPGPMKEAYKAGVLPLLGVIIFAFVVAPLVVAFLAAFWLSIAKNSNIPFLKSLHQAYVTEIQQGFSIEDVVDQNTTEQNTRLDYLQLIDFALENGGDSPTYPIQLIRGQHAVLQFNYVLLNTPRTTVTAPGGPACVFEDPGPNANLLDVFIGSQKLKSCPQVATRVGGCTADLGADEWTKFKDEFDHGDDPKKLVATLTLSRASTLQASCGVLHVHGSLTVYKDVVALKN